MNMVEGREVLALDKLLNVFQAKEGEINMYYGKIGNGKTYAATSDILDYLKQGKVVYANWKINVDDHDDRTSFFHILKNIITFNKTFYKIPCKQNLYYFDVDDGVYNWKGEKLAEFHSMADFIEYASNLNDCHIFADEAQDMFDSYEGTRFAKNKRRLILHTRHYHRSINIISQRPTAIQVSARGNVNRFYKCVKEYDWGFIRLFARYEFQEMASETVDETKDPESVKKYWGNKRVYNAYNSSYLANGIPKSQNVFFQAYELNSRERWYALYLNLYHKYNGMILFLKGLRRPPQP